MYDTVAVSLLVRKREQDMEDGWGQRRRFPRRRYAACHGTTTSPILSVMDASITDSIGDVAAWVKRLKVKGSAAFALHIALCRIPTPALRYRCGGIGLPHVRTGS
jgi:hypothetical protein